jgi:hypothetical protein
MGANYGRLERYLQKNNHIVRQSSQWRAWQDWQQRRILEIQVKRRSVNQEGLEKEHIKIHDIRLKFLCFISEGDRVVVISRMATHFTLIERAVLIHAYLPEARSLARHQTAVVFTQRCVILPVGAWMEAIKLRNATSAGQQEYRSAGL